MEDDLNYTLPENVWEVFEEPKANYGKRESNVEFAKKLRKRMKLASIEVIDFFEDQPNSSALNVIRFQLLKSSTSAAANYRAACRARSKREFYAKLCIVVEETDETLFWLEVLHDSKIKTDNSLVAAMGKEWQEILMIVAKAKANTSI